MENKGKIIYPVKIKIILQILLSIEYIHSKRIILRDLKWDNIMIHSITNDAILIDFDSSKLITNENQNNEHTSDIGSNCFIPPEQYLSNDYSSTVDIYSVGLIIDFILTEIPYDQRAIILLKTTNENQNNTYLKLIFILN